MFWVSHIERYLTSLQCHNKADLLHPTDTCKKSSGRGYVQVEMDPNLVEFQCFVTVLLQVCVHGLQQAWIAVPDPVTVSMCPM